MEAATRGASAATSRWRPAGSSRSRPRSAIRPPVVALCRRSAERREHLLPVGGELRRPNAGYGGKLVERPRRAADDLLQRAVPEHVERRHLVLHRARAAPRGEGVVDVVLRLRARLRPPERERRITRAAALRAGRADDLQQLLAVALEPRR